MSEVDYTDFEFERSFVMNQLPDEVSHDPHPDVIVQSYLVADHGNALRVRLQGPCPTGMLGLLTSGNPSEEAVLEAMVGHFTFCTMTAKGPGNAGTRYEAERELDVEVGTQLVRAGGNLVAKIRYALWLGEDGWIIDQFLGENSPLLVAEVERGSPVTDLAIPEFCVHEVSEDPRFDNDSLSRNPFSQWEAEFQRELKGRGPSFSAEFGTNEMGIPQI